ncbi:methylphosphotriester-DNA--protein-cysteine methyltransferase, partial [Janthinobacterium sp. CG_23.3]|uniref:Ada metal-binding domain-containing protein n=1 Tax=Janthinobacterium sp. CG_23.3 TaxID=3349634 RepID=UPI0038D37918
MNDTVYASEEQRWAAVQRRDSHADGAFYYSVRSTGVYCRPSWGGRGERRHKTPPPTQPQEEKKDGFPPPLPFQTE